MAKCLYYNCPELAMGGWKGCSKLHTLRVRQYMIQAKKYLLSQIDKNIAFHHGLFTPFEEAEIDYYIKLSKEWLGDPTIGKENNGKTTSSHDRTSDS